ncbi:MAG: hypothetical protein ACO4AI_09040 [Prochlorothrix sp.]|nr:hypothetical protein [Prochlorothrix sp.]
MATGGTAQATAGHIDGDRCFRVETDDRDRLIAGIGHQAHQIQLKQLGSGFGNIRSGVVETEHGVQVLAPYFGDHFPMAIGGETVEHNPIESSQALEFLDNSLAQIRETIGLINEMERSLGQVVKRDKLVMAGMVTGSRFQFQENFLGRRSMDHTLE